MWGRGLHSQRCPHDRQERVRLQAGSAHERSVDIGLGEQIVGVGRCDASAILDHDRFGHSRGDSLLRLVAMTIRSNLRKTDIVARLGGDEFVLLLPETGYEPAAAVLHKIHQLLLEKMQRCDFPVTCSIGAVTFLRPAESVEELIKRADACMYTAKKRGKNCMRHVLVGVHHETRPQPHCESFAARSGPHQTYSNPRRTAEGT